ncbi:hypothetical protein SDC9_209167 [bioreactor metagenome]|uniref:Uncharacterized protein n=1 Tax=bioreactor metagenome TaxID=1076179 RepID=A0A645JEB6_9ZZZZ
MRQRPEQGIASDAPRIEVILGHDQKGLLDSHLGKMGMHDPSDRLTISRLEQIVLEGAEYLGSPDCLVGIGIGHAGLELEHRTADGTGGILAITGRQITQSLDDGDNLFHHGRFESLSGQPPQHSGQQVLELLERTCRGTPV